MSIRAAFAGSDIQRNAVIKVGANNYTIRSIEVHADTGALTKVTVKPGPAVAVGGADGVLFSVVLPSIRVGPFGARVRETNSMEIGSDEGSVLASSLVILPSGPLPRGVIFNRP